MDVSVLSFGASSLGGVFHPVSIGQCIETVNVALDGGMNFIDVSPAYGVTLAETNLGRALRTIDRSRYYLATKIGSYDADKNDYDYSAERTEQSVLASLERLGVEQIDLIQCHDIEFADHDVIVNETLPKLHELKARGLVRYIGITGLPLRVFSSVLDRVDPGTVDTVLSFNHYELNDTSLVDHIPYLKEKGVGIINASPTGMGLLTERGVPDWHPAPSELVAGCRRAVEYCQKRGVDIVKLAVQFSCAHPGLATTLVGSARPENIRDNIAYVEEEIDEELMREVLAVLEPVHNHNFTRGLPENRDPILPAK